MSNTDEGRWLEGLSQYGGSPDEAFPDTERDLSIHSRANMSVQRYLQQPYGLTPDDNGEFVRYDAHQAEVAQTRLDTLRAARDAVPHDLYCESLDERWDEPCDCRWRPAVLAAIDALRQNQNETVANSAGEQS